MTRMHWKEKMKYDDLSRLAFFSLSPSNVHVLGKITCVMDVFAGKA